MAEITALTELQQMNLDILRLVQSDTAAAEKAIAFVAGSKLNFDCSKTNWFWRRVKERH